MRGVFDTNVLARAHQKAQGPARRALLDVVSGSHVLIVSPYLLLELERILTYPRLLKRSGLSPEDILEYIEGLAEVSSLVVPAPVPGEFVRDPSDVPILGTALAGRADVLCTRDADFFEERVKRFCASKGIRVLTDLEFLEELKA